MHMMNDFRPPQHYPMEVRNRLSLRPVLLLPSPAGTPFSRRGAARQPWPRFFSNRSCLKAPLLPLLREGGRIEDRKWQ